MQVPPNVLRSQVEDFEHAPNWLSTKQLERRDRILNVGRHLLALHGLRNLRICDLALAMNLTSAAIRTHFADLDALLIHILRSHNQAINKALSAIHHADPDATAKRRAAYLTATRGPCGNLSEAHLLLVRDATMLSETNYAAVQQSHEQYGIILAGALDADIVLTLLDGARLDPIRILTTIATLEGTDPALALPFLTPAPAPPPEPAPEEIEPPPAALPLPEPAWTENLAETPGDPFAPYQGQAPGTWIYNEGHARAPPHAA